MYILLSHPQTPLSVMVNVKLFPGLQMAKLQDVLALKAFPNNHNLKISHKVSNEASSIPTQKV